MRSATRRRRLGAAAAVAVVLTAALLSGSEQRSSAAVVRGGAQRIPAGLAAAIHARFGAGAIRSSSAATAAARPSGLGWSVALSADGTTALVGAAGAAYIFHVSDAGSWSSSETPTATLTDHRAGRFLYGPVMGLSADGTTAFVPAVPAKGTRIDVFHVSAADAWAASSTPTATLTLSTTVAISALAVSADGTTLVVGAPGDNGNHGLAYVFHASSESAWASTSTPTATLRNKDQGANDFFTGVEVAISGDGMTVLVSDYQDVTVGGEGAYVFHASGEDAWTSRSTPTAILSDSTSGDNTGLGLSLALSDDGTVVVLGASYANGLVGMVDVYDIAGEDAWTTTATPTAKLSYAGGKRLDYFGQEVAASADGDTVFVSALGLASGTGRGRVYTFHVAHEGDWVSSSAPAATLTNGGVHAGDDLGEGLAVSSDGTTALLGAPGVRFATGAAYAFHVPDAASWASSSTPTAALTVKALNACVVPQLKKLTVSAAKSQLKARSCRLGKVTRVHVKKGKKGRIVSQSVKPGSRPRIGTKVSVKVAK
jgi:hypothetical protein